MKPHRMSIATVLLIPCLLGSSLECNGIEAGARRSVFSAPSPVLPPAPLFREEALGPPVLDAMSRILLGPEDEKSELFEQLSRTVMGDEEAQFTLITYAPRTVGLTLGWPIYRSVKEMRANDFSKLHFDRSFSDVRSDAEAAALDIQFQNEFAAVKLALDNMPGRPWTEGPDWGKDFHIRIHGSNSYIMAGPSVRIPRPAGGEVVAFELPNGRNVFLISENIAQPYRRVLEQLFPGARICRLPGSGFWYWTLTQEVRHRPSTHIDGVVNAIPRQAVSDGVPILLVNPEYARHLGGLSDLQVAGMLRVVQVHPSEIYLNPANFAVSPEHHILINKAPLTIQRLLDAGMRPEFLHSLSEPIVALPRKLGSLGCLIGIADSVPNASKFPGTTSSNLKPAIHQVASVLVALLIVGSGMSMLAQLSPPVGIERLDPITGLPQKPGIFWQHTFSGSDGTGIKSLEVKRKEKWVTIWRARLELTSFADRELLDKLPQDHMFEVDLDHAPTPRLIFESLQRKYAYFRGKTRYDIKVTINKKENVWPENEEIPTGAPLRIVQHYGPRKGATLLESTVVIISLLLGFVILGVVAYWHWISLQNSQGWTANLDHWLPVGARIGSAVIGVPSLFLNSRLSEDMDALFRRMRLGGGSYFQELPQGQTWKDKLTSRIPLLSDQKDLRDTIQKSRVILVRDPQDPTMPVLAAQGWENVVSAAYSQERGDGYEGILFLPANLLSDIERTNNSKALLGLTVPLAYRMSADRRGIPAAEMETRARWLEDEVSTKFDFSGSMNPFRRVLADRLTQYRREQHAANGQPGVALTIVHTHEVFGTKAHYGKQAIERLLGHPAISAVHEAVSDGASYLEEHAGYRYVNYALGEHIAAEAERILILAGGHAGGCLHQQFSLGISAMKKLGGVWEVHLPLGGPIFHWNHDLGYSELTTKLTATIREKYKTELQDNIGRLTKKKKKEKTIYIAQDSESAQVHFIVWHKFESFMQYLTALSFGRSTPRDVRDHRQSAA